jgi:DNA-binding PadR family transcriptional regulator
MALEHAILVSLSERAGTGYELTRRFGKSIGFFWGASHQQIYRTLGRMVDQGWVTAEDVPQQGRPDRKVHRVTNEGRAELERWLAAPSPVATLRDELAVRLRGAAYLPDLSALVADVRRHRDEHASRYAVYLEIAARDFPEPAALRGQRLHQYLVLRGGIRVEQGFVEWCDDILSALVPEDIPSRPMPAPAMPPPPMPSPPMPSPTRSPASAGASA